jgi:hypothetical protein
MDIPEILATLGTQDTGRNQAKHHHQQHDNAHSNYAEYDPMSLAQNGSQDQY